MADGQRIIHRRLSRDYSDSSDDSDDNTSQKTTKNAPATAVTSASQVTSVKVPEKNGLVLKPSLSLEPYDVAYKVKTSLNSYNWFAPVKQRRAFCCTVAILTLELGISRCSRFSAPQRRVTYLKKTV
ncbi:hypothetical protein AVEN_220669-1 [Araneus ventricosus]|uniref:Uncharacterized protein n=1 Tax=Araneus ventricosus TaxID=182803 RepID=A0A4Y2UZ20_ARAVE|nr:hypothetical protein AVEN_110912-1 [Araneus ventricosus]GBO17483.1 hypothetical protein AVEN_220669-1 [Araneus ventricosus]